MNWYAAPPAARYPVAAAPVRPPAPVRPAATAAVPGRRQALVRRLLRYCGASAVSTAVGLTVLTALVATSTTSAAVANLIATAVGTIPSFELNRRWVWNHRDRRSLRRQVIPFCIMSFLSLGLSTLAVAAAASWASDSGLGSGARAVISDGASLAAFGAMWVVQYLVLDRVLFASGSGRGAVGTRAGTGLP